MTSVNTAISGDTANSGNTVTGIDYRKSPVSTSTELPATTISLTKGNPRASLTKQGGELRVNLNWRSQLPQVSGSFLKRLTQPNGTGVDLDLGCLYELTNGRKGVVQALGNSFGSFTEAPFIWLNGDDRSGQNALGEDLYVNLAHASQIRRVLVFAYIYDGAPDFDAAQAVVTLFPSAGAPIEIRLDEKAGKSTMCAVALIEGGAELTIRREVRYLGGGQRALDQAYGWGMNWGRGRK